MFSHSIRWRLQAWLAFLLILVLTGFCAAVYQLQHLTQFNQIDDELDKRVVALSAAVRVGPPFDRGPGKPGFGGRGREHPFDRDGMRLPPPPHDHPDGPPPFVGGDEPHPGMRELRLSSELLRQFDETQTNSYYFAVWSRSGNLLRRSTNAPVELAQPERVRGDTRTYTRLRDAVREAYHFTELGECVLVGRSVQAELVSSERFHLLLFAAGGAVLALGLGGGWWLTTRAFRPIEEISIAASRISAGNLSERVPVSEPEDELGRLASLLNSTFARLDEAFAQQRQFTADASHELRTPLAVLISETQTALSRERTPGEYRDSLEACLDTAQQMRRLIESLLELARCDATHRESPRERLDLAARVRACVERLQPLAEQRPVRLTCDLGPAEVLGIPEQVDQVLTNLLANAIHYNVAGGEIRLRTRVENGRVLLTVADTGVGISAEDLPHIFARFYRADKSRARAEGHCGLGLAIGKAIVAAHGGTIAVESTLGAGTTFTVSLPAAPPPS